MLSMRPLLRTNVIWLVAISAWPVGFSCCPSSLVAESVPQSAAERAVQVKFGGAKYSVELFGGKFEAFDAGHVIVDEAGVEHDNQCVLCGYSLVDLVSQGVFPDLSVRHTRRTRLAAGFRDQAKVALERLGPVSGHMSVAVARAASRHSRSAEVE